MTAHPAPADPADSPEAAENRGLTPQARQALEGLPPALAALGHAFVRAGHEIALVGGPVRDAFLGVAPHDLDLTTSARPEQTEKILAAWGETTWDVGRAFGTIGARKGSTIVEVTTYRTEAYEVGSRKPQVTYGDTLTGDLTFHANGTVASTWDQVAAFRGVSEGDVIRYAIPKREPLALEQERFRDAVRGVAQRHVTMAEGVATLDVVEAVLTSASENRTVTL
mgnify:FL=1